MDDEFIPTERIALITLDLARGKVLTTTTVSANYGVTMSGARRMLYKLSRVLPLAQDGQQWYLLDGRSEIGS